MSEQHVSRQSRLSYVDLFRAAGIILMVMGHVWFGRVFDTIIHVFHMPMFYFITGFFFADCDGLSDIKKRVKKRAQALLIPYLAYALLHYLIYFCFKGWDAALLRLFVFNTEEGGIPIAGALWFLTSLFLADLFYLLLSRCLGYGIKLHICVAVLAVFGNLCGVLLPFRPPVGLDTALVGLGFMHIGRVMKKEQIPAKLLNLKPLQLALISIAAAALIFLNSPVNLRKGEYGIIPLFWLGSVAAIISLWNLCRRINSWLENKMPRIHHWIVGIGKDSIVYLCLNQLMILAAQKIITPLHPNVYLNSILVFVLAMIFLEAAKFMILHTPLAWTVGKT